MTRAVNGVTTKARHKKVLERAKGFRGRNKSCYSIAKRKVEHGLQYAFRDRKARKNVFRALWIQRINAAARQYDLRYSTLMDLLHKHAILIDRKMLAELAANEPAAFADLVAKLRA